MGVINVTPDSFSDGGAHLQHSAAVDAARRMIEEGADLLDVGGESTRPGAEPVDSAEEARRVVPVIEAIRRSSGIPISVDTTKSAVAAAAIDAGADIVNDVSALRMDPAMIELVRTTGVAAILMHMRGTPATMQQNIAYHDLLGEIEDELGAAVRAAVDGGVERRRLLVDPGIGFGKTFEHNLEILSRCGELRRVAPLVIGASRKAFIGKITGRNAGPERMPGSLAAVAAAALGGAAMVRVHDVRETVDFLRVLEAILIQ